MSLGRVYIPLGFLTYAHNEEASSKPNRRERTIATMLESSRPKLPNEPSIQKWQQTFRDMGAEWEYNGGDVCALYTLSGKVSDYYFNSEVISKNPQMLSSLCREVYLPELQRLKISVDLVASYPPYGVAFANSLAQALGVGSCFISSLSSPNIEQEVNKGTRILAVADDIFSGSSLVKTIQAALVKQCKVVPVVFAFGNFSGRASLEGFDIFSVINRRVELFDVADSPLVARGVRPVNAREHWGQLFAPGKA